MKPEARYYTMESDPGYLGAVTDLRRREDPNAPAATFKDNGQVQQRDSHRRVRRPM